MYCSTCGASIPAGRSACGTCGTSVLEGQSARLDPGTSSIPGTSAQGNIAVSAVCPRCDYGGYGLPYFSRGSHVAGLVAATLFTLPYALGAGGLLYYGLRHDHRVCPRCGEGWGKFGRAAVEDKPTRAPMARGVRPPGANEGVKRTWSVLLFALGAIMLAVGAVEFEALIFVMGVLASAGAVVLHKAANKAREDRRTALMAALQMPVLKLAAERKGQLTVTDVAASLGWSLRRAEKVLQSLDDGWRVNSDITDEGVIVYEFRELLLGRGPPPEEEG